jgi:hypothetical protein
LPARIHDPFFGTTLAVSVNNGNASVVYARKLVSNRKSQKKLGNLVSISDFPTYIVDRVLEATVGDADLIQQKSEWVEAPKRAKWTSDLKRFGEFLMAVAHPVDL